MSENKTIRIKTTPNGSDKFLKLKLEQDFSFIEILSLKLSQEDVYRKFCADYGVIVGRCVVNQGFGVPNAKVSVFIPISDVDKLNPEIQGLYPYELVTDKNNEGIRYNLLPKDSDNQDPCFTPIGTFPSKREFLDNDELLDIYCKYYKFTTTTNHAGDFMMFGVPLGNYIVQVDADISDIGLITQKPYDLIGKGTPQKLFDSPSKFKSDKNLDKLVQVKTLRSGITVKPFWGDLENCEIGINRLDFDLQTNITPSAIFVGSIFGDNEKHSVNKHCRPRRDLGKLCEMVAGEGTVEMIRKTFDGNIEQFDVEGGRVIDNNGAWAYQIPMNLDYVITDEVGNLIPSDDPNIGLPTRASVRFRIGMDVNGSEGRLRTRAKYLVPHNPQNFIQSDYTFDDTTKDDNFRDLYWNKIYSIKNFIPRYQTNSLITNKNFIGIKDVDGCVGTHNPFPYNRLLSDFNPIFGILCVIINIIVNVIALINNIIIYAVNNFFISPLNSIISVINSIMNSIVGNFCYLWNKVNGLISIGGCPLSWSGISPIQYVNCIVLKCGDSNDTYSPGCNQGSNPGFQSGTTHYPNDGHGHGIDAGLADCYLIQLADALNIFQFDFYNDWVNGSLYAFLLKYKKRKHGQEKFCEYDCAPNFSGGVDGNNDNIPDNNCSQNYLIDSCAYDTNVNSINTILPPNVNYSKSFSLNDGLIKKVDDEFYYAAYTHSGNKLLFATDIIHLGSIFDCDWQGIPKIEQLLIPTTYKRPPNVSEYDEDPSSPTYNQKLVCGISSIGNNTPNDGLFFDIDCLGIKVSTLRCQNIKKQCEFGVELDSAETNSSATSNPPSCNIGPEEIEGDNIYFRDVFYTLNNSGINIITYPYSTVINTSFASSTNNPTAILGPTVGLTEYNKFRNYIPNTDSDYEQPIGNSYFFYFGLIPSKSAVDLLKTKYFTKCNVVIKEDFKVIGNVTDVTYISGNDGIINGITVIGNSTAPFIYNWSGPAGFTSTSQNIFNLIVGTYKIIVTDANGFIGKASFTVNQPQPTFCTVSINKDSYTSTSNDGEIIINAIGGGIPPYFYNLTGPVTSSGGPAIFNSFIINNLPIGNYIMTIYDSSASPTYCTTNLTINSATALNVNVNKLDSGCFNSYTGSININVTSGVPPYTVLTTLTIATVLVYSSPLLIQGGLSAGIYTVTVQDALSQINIQNIIINEDPQMYFSGMIKSPQCDPTKTIFYYEIIDPSTTISWLSSPWTITVDVDGITSTNVVVTPVSSTPNFFKIEINGAEALNNYVVKFVNSKGCSVSDQTSKLSAPRPTTALIGNITSLNISTNTVQLTANPSGGNSPYTYLWTDLWASAIISTSPFIYTNKISGHPFSCLISDSVGCQITLYYTIP